MGEVFLWINKIPKYRANRVLNFKHLFLTKDNFDEKHTIFLLQKNVMVSYEIENILNICATLLSSPSVPFYSPARKKHPQASNLQQKKHPLKKQFLRQQRLYIPRFSKIDYSFSLKDLW